MCSEISRELRIRPLLQSDSDIHDAMDARASTASPRGRRQKQKQSRFCEVKDSSFRHSAASISKTNSASLHSLVLVVIMTFLLGGSALRRVSGIRLRSEVEHAANAPGADPLATVDSQSISMLQLSQVVDSPARRQAMQAVERLCMDNQNYAFIQCHKNSNGALDIKAGLFGAGIAVNLVNNPSMGVQIFKNCPGNPASLDIPVFEPSCKLDPTAYPSVAVFLKVMQSTAEAQNAISVDSDSAFQKEVKRTRASTFLDINGHPFSAPLYDILDLRTNTVHAIQKDTYFQGFLDAVTTAELLTEMSKILDQSVKGNLSSVAFKYATYRALPVQTSKEWGVIMYAVKRAQNEMWMRARLKLKLVDTVLLSTLDMWNNGLMHCDLHFNNVMHLKTFVRDKDELLRIFHDGTAIAPTVNAYYFERVLPPAVLSQLQQRHADGNVGVPVYYLMTPYVRYIDIAYLLRLPPGDRSAAPCFINRGERHEDLSELWRGGINFAFPLPSGTKWNRIETQIAAQHKELWMNLANEQQQLLEQLKSTQKSIENLMGSLRKEVEKIPELLSCQHQRTYATREVQYTLKVLKNVGRASSLMHPEMCSLEIMKTGVRKMRLLIQKSVWHYLPAEATWNFGFERPEVTPAAARQA